MASVTDICNRALQKLGAKRIVSMSENSTNARACNASYESLRDAELTAHPWNFAVARATIGASATTPVFGKANSFPLPSDYLRLLPPDPECNYNWRDWQIEGRNIVTNDQSPLQIRYISKVTDTTLMDPLFREALASRIAIELCEELTQSNSKKQACATDYKATMLEARRVNAIVNRPQDSAEDDYITVRS